MIPAIEEVEFFNGGDAQSFKLQYDQPDGPKHAISYWVLNAPKQSFFKVPRQMPTPYGGTVMVDFIQQALEKFGDRGFIAVVAGIDVTEELAYANTRDDAKRKGIDRWKKFCRAKIQEFDDENDLRVSQGRVKMKPSGFVVHAHRELGIAVPNEEVYKTAENSKSDVDELKEILKKQQEQITELLAQKKPEAQGARK